MTKEQANAASLKANIELLSLNPSSIIELYTIDITDIFLDNFLAANLNNIDKTVFRFHNNLKGIDLRKTTSIWFQDQEFVATPIKVEGFETNARGTLPQPKLSICVDETNIPQLALLKEKIFELGDLTGAKFVRQRTFAKFLDEKNFTTLPDGFIPDPNVELGRDIFYIERKSLENKYIIEFELSSSFDVEGIKIPLRLVTANKCLFCYRGEGCNYEYKDLRTEAHGTAILPDEAPPLFNVNNEFIPDILDGIQVKVRGLYNPTIYYEKGDAIYLEKDFIKYWFVCKSNNPLLGPPSAIYWIAEQCSKDIKGCKKRFDYLTDNRINTPYPPLTYPFGGFAGVRKVQEVN